MDDGYDDYEDYSGGYDDYGASDAENIIEEANDNFPYEKKVKNLKTLHPANPIPKV